jgi:hypothetical protein
MERTTRAIIVDTGLLLPGAAARRDGAGWSNAGATRRSRRIPGENGR